MHITYMPGISRHPRFFWRGDTEVLLGVDILAIGTVLPAGPGGRTPGQEVWDKGQSP